MVKTTLEPHPSLPLPPETVRGISTGFVGSFLGLSCPLSALSREHFISILSQLQCHLLGGPLSEPLFGMGNCFLSVSQDHSGHTSNEAQNT